MIQARECRLGNTITHYSGHQVIVFSIERNSGRYYINGIGEGMFTPIPLTPEILVKCGFTFHKKKSGTQGVYTNGKMNLAISNGGNIYRVNKIIPYLHQLQNLYFALTGQELTYTGE